MCHDSLKEVGISLGYVWFFIELDAFFSGEFYCFPSKCPWKHRHVEKEKSPLRFFFVCFSFVCFLLFGSFYFLRGSTFCFRCGVFVLSLVSRCGLRTVCASFALSALFRPLRALGMPFLDAAGPTASRNGIPSVRGGLNSAGRASRGAGPIL